MTLWSEIAFFHEWVVLFRYLVHFHINWKVFPSWAYLYGKVGCVEKKILAAPET